MSAGQKANSGARPMSAHRFTGPQVREKSGYLEAGLSKMIHISKMNLPPKFSRNDQHLTD